MNFDIDDNNVISIKQKLKDSLNNQFLTYLTNKIKKNVKDCNLLYTQVCYLVKLFLIYDYEQNINNNNEYDFNELFIRFCFKVIKNNSSELLESEKKDIIKVRLFNFIKNFNNFNTIPFVCPENIDSISHITNALSRDISTNIKNNITINFTKYLKEYIKINLTIEYENNDFKITYEMINSVFNDILHNTFYSNNIFHSWIHTNKNLIIPDFSNNIIQIDSIQNGLIIHHKILKTFIMKYIKNNESLEQICKLNSTSENKIKKNHNIIYEDIINNSFKSSDFFYDWIIYNIPLIKNSFNSTNFIDIESELISNPFKFIKHMLYMNKNLEINKSTKHYQIIPLRTNMRPKHISINTHALVDILDSSYLDNIKNYYHNDTLKGLDVWNKYFLFTSDYIKQIIKKGYVFSGLILTNGYEIIFNFYSKKYIDNKNNFHSLGKNEIKNKKEITKDLRDDEKEEFFKQYELTKEENKLKKKKETNEKFKKKKELEKQLEEQKIKNVEEQLKILNDKFTIENENLKIHIFSNDEETLEYKNDKYKSSLAYLTHCFNRDKETLINDYKNDIDEKFNKILVDDEKINLKIDKLKILLKNKKNSLKKFKSKKVKDIDNGVFRKLQTPVAPSRAWISPSLRSSDIEYPGCGAAGLAAG